MKPRVSVVVPVRDRRELLGRMLDALARQTFTDFEVIVVDDGSTDGSAEEALVRAGDGSPVRVIRSGRKGAVAARGIGVESASGQILAFTDSDCVPEPDWLARAVKAIDDGADVVKGLTRPARWPLAPFERTMASYDDELYPTCNMIYTRNAYEAAGGFDEQAAARLGFRWGGRARGLGFGEDALLAWRARRSGARVEYEPRAVVEHAVFAPDIRESLSRTMVVAAFPALLREVPELCPQLLRRGFLFGPRSRAPFYLTVSLAALRRPRLAGASLLWWAACRARDLRGAPVGRKRKLVLLPAEMAMDAGTGLALVLGSIRARKPVL